MWLLFHHAKGTKHVAGGRVLTEHCPTCNEVTRLDEVEMTEQVGVWFVDLAGDTERGFRCRVCGDVFSRAERSPKAIDAVSAAERDRARVDALAVEQRRRDAERAAKATRIEDELAELKKRMGR